MHESIQQKPVRSIFISPRWHYKKEPPAKAISDLSNAINVNPYLSVLLLQRGINHFDQAKSFFRPSLDDLHDPLLMLDMDVAVERIKKAIDCKEKILIYGDYDVDGMTSVSMVYRYLQKIAPCDYYIPDRNKEGYGISTSSIIWAEQNGFSLIIALDLGIRALESASLAQEKKIDLIICDHHLPGKSLPEAVAILNPKKPKCRYPFKELSGCGIGFKLLQAYTQKHDSLYDIYANLDLVAVSIAADLVPLYDENRVLLHHGIQRLKEKPCPGLSALKETTAIRDHIDTATIVFQIAPRINAIGRLKHGKQGVALLTAQHHEEALLKAYDVNATNEDRKKIDAQVTQEAFCMIDAEPTSKRSYVLYNAQWHQGVVGIVASRCVEKYFRPTLVLTAVGDHIVGSGRSIPGFDLHEALTQCSNFLMHYGGHQHAAGVTLKEEYLEPFRKKFESVVHQSTTENMFSPLLHIDATIPLHSINQRFYNVTKRMGPFGPYNQRPIFASQHVWVQSKPQRVGKHHLRFVATDRKSNISFAAIAFNMADAYIDRMSTGTSCAIAYSIKENTYRERISLELNIKDIKFE